ncbi:MAG: hypothetical protein EPN94_12150 [Nitrospirae bacterium]|nr:MAG: hypothetical protein EPN94_12150 [Nitrospirota bacterium]
MTIEQYYTAPPQEVFDEIKREAEKIWSSYEEPYRSEKLDRIKDTKNVSDNAWYIVAMFDYQNRAKLIANVSKKTAHMIIDAST